MEVTLRILRCLQVVGQISLSWVHLQKRQAAHDGQLTSDVLLCTGLRLTLWVIARQACA